MNSCSLLLFTQFRNEREMLGRVLRGHLAAEIRSWHQVRAFGSAYVLAEKALPPQRKIEENEITESFLKGSGPGGQKINKTSSAVQLKHIPTGIVVKCQKTRSREQNRKFARQILGERLDELEKGDASRTAIKTERARTKKASAAKKSRRKYKKLEDESASTTGEANQSDGDESDRALESSNSSDVTIEQQSEVQHVDNESHRERPSG